jgi:hypothetical protein
MSLTTYNKISIPDKPKWTKTQINSFYVIAKENVLGPDLEDVLVSWVEW